MCGIAGIIASDTTALDPIGAMLDTLVHRGPDGGGSWTGTGVALGHRRLAIIDLSDDGRQPMQLDGRYTVVFNGEIYNYIELRAELEALGRRFRTRSDTEVLLAAYAEWGTGCLERLNGMWAFAIHDSEARTVLLARDRMGKKPLLLARGPGFLAFASEAKALLAHPRVARRPDLDELRRYLAHGTCAWSEHTSFAGITRLPPASWWLVRTDRDPAEAPSPRRWWSLAPTISHERHDPARARALADQYYHLLKEAVAFRLRADVRVGTALSGGLDSSSIAYLVREIRSEQGRDPSEQETFSSVYTAPGTEHCDESSFIAATAAQLQVRSNTIEPLAGEIIARHRDLIRIMEDPPESTCMSGWHTFLLVARRGVRVTLDGQGADEQLAGYLDYLSVHGAARGFAGPGEVLAFRHVPGALRHAGRGWAQGQIARLGPAGSGLLRLLGKRGVLHTDVNERLAADCGSGLLNLIHYSDRVSMGHSVESRMPFLDVRLMEFLASVPSTYKIHDGWTKHLARLAFAGRLPDQVVWRRDKMGWPIPEDRWFRGQLRPEFAGAIRSCPLLRELGWDGDIDRLLDDRRQPITPLVRLYNLATWRSVFLDPPNTAIQAA